MVNGSIHCQTSTRKMAQNHHLRQRALLAKSGKHQLAPAARPAKDQHRKAASYSGFPSVYLANVRKLFQSHGEFCASQPWEVIVTTITFLVCLLTVLRKRSFFSDVNLPTGTSHCTDGGDEQTVDAGGGQMENIVLTLLRCLAVLHCYYRFKRIHRLGSTFVMKIAASYLAFTLVLFFLIASSLGAPTSMKVRLLYDSWFLVLLFMDMQRVARMAQFALSSSHLQRINENVAHGMYVLAPTFTLDVLIKILLMGMGCLTGIPKLEVYAWYAIVFNMVNFIVFMTFFPSGLSLVLELMYCTEGQPKWDVRKIIRTLPFDDTSHSPVVYKFRIAGTLALLVLHVVCHRPLILTATMLAEHLNDKTVVQYSTVRFLGYLLFHNFEQIVVMSAMVLLAVKCLINEDVDESSQMKKTYMEKLMRKLEEDGDEMQDLDQISNSTDEGISLGNCAVTVGSPGICKGTYVAPVRSMRSTDGEDQSSTDSNWSVLTAPDQKDREVQTTDSMSSSDNEGVGEGKAKAPIRSLEECVKISMLPDGPQMLTDDEIIMLVEAKHIRGHVLEKVLNNYLRGVEIRRKLVMRAAKLSQTCISNIPYKGYDYEIVMGACAESVIGYMTVPLGVVGPLKLDNKLYTVPMATTEGCLVASTNRGCSALRGCGVTSHITGDGMARAPVLRFTNSAGAVEAKAWIEEPGNFEILKKYFDSTSRFARLERIHARIAGRLLYVRFIAKCGDAMGMNMLSKGTEFTLNKMLELFPDMTVLSLSGNTCTDKKPAAVNWIEGRGKSVVCEAIVPANIVETTLKTTTTALVELNSAKNQTGSAMAGSIGGFNAHAANVVTAVFIATGQDAAQNIGSSNCMTLMEPWGRDGRDLYITCTMPSIEVGTVGGGTVLATQSACLEMLGVRGPHPTSPGQNSCQLARIVCGAVLAGELSLLSALAAGDLVKSHLRHNRSTAQFGRPARGTSDTTLSPFVSSSTLCSSLPSSPSCGLLMKPIDANSSANEIDGDERQNVP